VLEHQQRGRARLPAASVDAACEHDRVNASTRLARIAVEALRVGGVRHVTLCPGSRSAPLAYALQSVGGNPRLHVRHDERVAGFIALGASGAVVTTSGTAAANLHPAVLEAHHSRRPLVVVTADRPPELRGTWANQTSELQADLFGAAVRARIDLTDADAEKDPETALRALIAALGLSRGPRPGPVHLNLGFSDPLTPDDADDEWLTGRPPEEAEGARATVELPVGQRRTIVIAGDRAGPQARAVASTAGWPLLAEPSSGVAGAAAVAAGRLLLEVPELARAIERVVAFGRPTLSRPVTRLLSDPDVELVLVSPYDDWPDPGRPAQRAHALRGTPTAAGNGAWTRRWAGASDAARNALDLVLDAATQHGQLPGPVVAREVALAMGEGEVLVAAASNPVRDLDLVGQALPGGVRVVANRGLSGIDGTVSTATGLALDGGFVRVLVGDLAFLHDLNALLVPPGEARPRLQVVVLNDDGGGIFGLLEQGERAARGAADAAVFERLFGTPHGADVRALCAGYGVAHRQVTSAEALRSALGEPAPGTSVVEVRTSRAGLRELHARIRAAVHAAVREVL
jgi:2-succinyl-5-enolpyruvyl-6-hydroxy-3-cyclohexene-1-carboxylate synthase